MSQDWEDDLPNGCVPVPSWVDEQPSYLAGLPFWTVTPAVFEKGPLELSPYQTDIARILEATSVKDITALEDASLLDSIVRVISVGSPGAGGVLNAQGHTWNPPVNETVTSINLNSDPKVYVAGNAQVTGYAKSWVPKEDHQNEQPSPKKKGRR